ncbi:hypothetical protein Dfulv_10720 [Dactylosporangium fulvum]|uniref:Uncharacterized protein n=1 Tax=Dactylosporangium fulvum TaxID=53359 RepID=A0ABY5W9C2_9ACTN|nr:hypothetical protein [Dactylosporangium fulvum]UWP84671.1 hypothetical protein Dfulv_10720 [Dactylosporangium fulvum]
MDAQHSGRTAEPAQCAGGGRGERGLLRRAARHEQQHRQRRPGELADQGQARRVEVVQVLDDEDATVAVEQRPDHVDGGSQHRGRGEPRTVRGRPRGGPRGAHRGLRELGQHGLVHRKAVRGPAAQDRGQPVVRRGAEGSCGTGQYHLGVDLIEHLRHQPALAAAGLPGDQHHAGRSGPPRTLDPGELRGSADERGGWHAVTIRTTA